jgi:hypothetical protein
MIFILTLYVLANLVIVPSYHIDLDRQFWSLFLHDANLLRHVTYRRRVDHRHIDVLNNRTKTVYNTIESSKLESGTN